MANDIDMWKDIEELENSKVKRERQIAKDLHKLYVLKFINIGTPEEKLQKAREKFEKKWGFWGNW